MTSIKIIAYIQFLTVLGIVFGFYLGNSKYWVPFDLALTIVLAICGVVLLKHKSNPKMGGEL